MKRTNFLTLTRSGARPVNGYYIGEYGYYKNGHKWRAIHHTTGLMVAEAKTLKAARAATKARQPQVQSFMNSAAGQRSLELYAKACADWFAAGNTLATTTDYRIRHREDIVP